MPEARWDSLGNLVPIFTIDTDSTLVPDRYPFQLEITAVIEETLEVVTVVIDYSHGAVVDFAGYGPEIVIQAFTADDIVPGEEFIVYFTIENVGDDTLRDVFIDFQVDGTDEYDWDFEVDFKNQFNWEEVFMHWGEGGAGQMTWENAEFPSDMFYTMESLDVDNIREIVEINLYADGVFSDPSATIEVIKIIDLAPGASINVQSAFFADKDMVNGKPYVMQVNIQGVDSDGAGAYVAPGVNRQITVMSSLPGTSYNPVELDWFDAGIKALGLFLFFIIVLAILLFVYNMFKGDPYDEDEDDFDFEDDEPDFEPAPEPADEASDDLVEP
jgi:cbb3-type cytochrome oxidase subunit 3